MPFQDDNDFYNLIGGKPLRDAPIDLPIEKKKRETQASRQDALFMLGVVTLVFFVTLCIVGWGLCSGIDAFLRNLSNTSSELNTTGYIAVNELINTVRGFTGLFIVVSAGVTTLLFLVFYLLYTVIVHQIATRVMHGDGTWSNLVYHIAIPDLVYSVLAVLFYWGVLHWFFFDYVANIAVVTSPNFMQDYQNGFLLPIILNWVGFFVWGAIVARRIGKAYLLDTSTGFMTVLLSSAGMGIIGGFMGFFLAIFFIRILF